MLILSNLLGLILVKRIDPEGNSATSKVEDRLTCIRIRFFVMVYPDRLTKIRELVDNCSKLASSW